jgi:phosphoglycerate dehydrogenase-like enzyme
VVQALNSGAEAVDLAAAKSRRIAVRAAPGAETAARTGMVLALPFARLRRLSTLDDAIRTGL